MAQKRICVIGAGPAGMSMLHHLAEIEDMPDVVCFEKQSTWGGQWNLSWKTGLDENGEPIQTSQYKFMWCNVPKEAFEYYDYTFDQHFGRTTPSFPSRIVLRDYLEGRFKKRDPEKRNLKDFIHFNTAVRLVKYVDERDEFKVSVNDYNTGSTREERFSHVVVSTGIFHTPNIPDISGMNEFKGRILHSHDFRDAREFSGQRVLLVGAGITGEDIMLQCIKFGVKHVILAYRTQPKSAIGIMPDGVEEKPNVVSFDATQAYFKDGSSAEIDSVILTTGYRNYFPFLEERFRIPEETHPYPEGLYKGTLFYEAGNNRMFYIGALEQFHSFTYFEVMAKWACKYITEQLPDEPKTMQEMENDAKEWIKRANAIKSEFDIVEFQTDLIENLAELGGYNKAVLEYSSLLKQLLTDRKERFGLANYRDRCYKSIQTGAIAPKQTPFMQNYDDSIETYVKCK